MKPFTRKSPSGLGFLLSLAIFSQNGVGRIATPPGPSLVRPVPSTNSPSTNSRADPIEKWEYANPGPHSREVLWTHPSSNPRPNGVPQWQTNRFVQLESGLNFLSESGRWELSRVDIEPGDGGGAVALHGQHKVWFSGQFKSRKTVQMRMPDGRRMVSHVHGLAYYDAAIDRAVLIAQARESDAWLYPPNQILYPEAFDSISADVRYTYTTVGLEQDIILHEAPPEPGQFGMNPATTRLEVWTEFVECPEPKRHFQRALQTSSPSDTDPTNTVWDEELDFGSMRMGTGRTFALGREEDGLALVAKQWVVEGNRRFLVEAVALPALATSLQTLPATPGGASVPQADGHRWQVLHQLPTRVDTASPGNSKLRQINPIMMAQLRSRRGIVLDYNTVNTSLTNFTFAGDSTYLITGLVTLSGTNATFEGGTVVKFSRTNSSRLQVTCPVTCLGDIYQPVILTASDDSTVGEQVNTNSPSGYYAAIALDLEPPNSGTSYTFNHLRIAYASVGLLINQSTGHNFSHLQLMNCQTGIRPLSTDMSLHNALFVNVRTNFDGVASTGSVEHVTVDGAAWLNANNTFTAANLKLTNALLVNVTNTGGYTPTAVSLPGSSAGLFQTVGGGSHYLASGSPYRDAGVPGISPALAGDFRQMSTFPPLLWTNPIVTSTTLTPTSQRDTDIPDLGYHYPALDYQLTTPLIVTNAVLTLADGVTLGFAGPSCFWLQAKSSLSSFGWAQQMNVLTRSSSVMEGPIPGGTTPQYSDTVFLGYVTNAPPTNYPSVTCRFTSIYLGSPQGYHFYWDFSGFNFSSIKWSDCQLFGGNIIVLGSSSPVASSSPLSFNNNLFYRNYLDIEGLVPLTFYNQLMLKGTLLLFPGAFNSREFVRDNQFDTVDIWSDQPPLFAYSNNAYVRTNGLGQLLPLSPSDVILTNFVYAAPTNGLGRWYQGQANLVNAGSQSASLAGLYQETTQPTPSKEGATQVDIGFHYVSVDANGKPLDFDSDGFADYIEDINGNGTVDGIETAWDSSSDLGFRILITQPRANTALP